MRTGLGIFLGAVLALSSGCLAPGNLPACNSWDSGRSICRLMNPEDLSVLPGEQWMLVSEMTHSDPRESDEGRPFKSGRLTAIRLSERGGEAERRVLYPQEWDEELPDTIRWGDPDCAGPPTSRDFQPHGIDVGPGPNGESALAVVTHGAREVIDLFEIAPGSFEIAPGGSQETTDALETAAGGSLSAPDALESAAGSDPLLEWRGCVPVPETMTANDVALVEGGGLVVTNFMPRFDEIGFSALWTLVKISFGAESGSVLRWRPGGEFVEIPNSAGSAPNGIAATPDGKILYVAEWGAEKVYRLRMSEGSAAPVRDEVAVEGSPDNLTWTPDGQLLVAAQNAGPIRALGCGRIKSGGCDVGYSITRIDPDRFEATPIATGRGAASVALELGDEIYVGVFAGDSITRAEGTD